MISFTTKSDCSSNAVAKSRSRRDSVSKLHSVDRIHFHRDGAAGSGARTTDRAVAPASAASRPVPLVAVGASTGGPQALEKILSKWPDDFPAAVIVAQHIGADFAESLVHWLTERSKSRVTCGS